MTRDTSGMSSPRAATSVATSRGVLPSLKASMAALRVFWLRSPWMAAAWTQYKPVTKLPSLEGGSLGDGGRLGARGDAAAWGQMRR